MKEIGLDCVVATSHDNVLYSSSVDLFTINLVKRLAAVFIPVNSEPVFGVHAYEEVTAREFTWIEDLRIYKGGEWEPCEPIQFVADVLREKGLSDGRIGIEMLDMPALWLEHLKELLPSTEFLDCRTVFDRLRATKSPEELKLLSEANMATAKAITVAFEMARPGDTERKIARDMISLTHEYGADQTALMVLAAGDSIFESHHVPTDYRIKKGDLVRVDFSCFFKGYMTDIARMAVVGQPDERQLKAYDITVRTERAAAEAMKVGARIIDVHDSVKQFLETVGVEYDGEFIGHSIGIGCHEVPFLGPSHGDWVLESGMFFQVEPFLTIGQVLVQTEDSFMITAEGARNVSEYRDITELQVIR